MTPFEYVTVLISIILGLGITQIISGVADLIHHNDRVKTYWPHTLWIILAFFLHVQEWWQIYELRGYTGWYLPVFIFLILYPINLFILARILFPIGSGDTSIDLKSFYFANFRKFFFFLLLLAVVAALENVFIHHIPPVEQVLQLAIFITSLLFVIKDYRQQWAHKLFVIILLSIMLASLAIYWDEWLLI